MSRRRRGRRHGALAMIVALGVAACGGDLSGPSVGDGRLEVITGDGQQGLEGRPLPGEIVVAVTDAAGEPLVGVDVAGSVISGGGSLQSERMRTDRQGWIRALWTLGAAAERDQRLRLWAAGGQVVLRATALPSSAGDLVVVREAAGPLKGLVVTRGENRLAFGLRENVREADTLVRVQPRDEGVGSVVVFPWANPPELASARWTPGVDTVEVRLRRAPRIDVSAVIHVAPFGETRAALRRDLVALRRVIRDEGLGIEIGRVTVRDGTGGGPVEVDGPRACQGSGPVSKLEVRYVHRIRGFAGYGCPPGRVFMSAERDPSSVYLFPHEVGHVLALSHTAFGLMHPSGRFPGLTEGEVFRAHFDARSSLNLSFGASPGAGPRLCNSGAGCLPRDFELGPEGAP